jgi:hypothetical protein
MGAAQLARADALDYAELVRGRAPRFGRTCTGGTPVSHDPRREVARREGMNYLGHYVFNHERCRLDAQPYFVMGVALPDLWPQFSGTRRIRWGAVRRSPPLTTVRAPWPEPLMNKLLDRAARLVDPGEVWGELTAAPVAEVAEMGRDRRGS